MSWGWSSPEDQQLAGLIMWMPAGLIYAIAGGRVDRLGKTEEGLPKAYKISTTVPVECP